MFSLGYLLVGDITVIGDRIQFYHCTYGHGYHTACHHPPEEHAESPLVGQIAGYHSGEHHAKGLQTGAYAEDACTSLAFGKVNQEQHVCCESESIS